MTLSVKQTHLGVKGNQPKPLDSVRATIHETIISPTCLWTKIIIHLQLLSFIHVTNLLQNYFDGLHDRSDKYTLSILCVHTSKARSKSRWGSDDHLYHRLRST